MPDRSRSQRKPELLAPAGDDGPLRAAVANGADAVYFGLEDFNARRRAANFTLARLPETMDYLHGRNVRGYVTLNTLIFSDELEQAADFVAGIAEAGADAVIVQDLGLIRLIRRMAPTLPIHASTQMTQTHAEGIEMLGEMGVRRVILARELSIDQIARIARSTNVELEVFVHGAICISYSGQCLASESLWGRSANRGACAQACRLPYQLVVDGRARDLDERLYLLSAKDLAAWELIPRLIAAGVSGFKIEGRLKSAHYVAAATAAYREAIDAAVQGRPFQLSRERELDLAQSFSRGFTHGFLEGDRHQDLVDGRFPKSRGMQVGKVVGKTRHGVIVEVQGPLDAAGETPLKPGDGVVFDPGHPQQDEQGGRIYAVKQADSAQPAAREHRAFCLELEFGHGEINLAAVAPGSSVWKTDDPAIRRRLEITFARDRMVTRVPLRIQFSISPQGRLVTEATDEDGHSVSVESPEPLQPARRHPLSLALLGEQFGRMGDTPFALSTIELLDAGKPVDSLPLMAPKSLLNQLRREVTRLLLEKRTAESRHAVVEQHPIRAIRQHIRGGAKQASQQETTALPKLCVLARDLAQLKAVLDWHSTAAQPGPSIAWCDFADHNEYARALEMCRAAGVAAGLATTRICKPGEEDLITGLADLSPDAVLVRNLAALRLLRRQVPDLTLVGDYSLNAANEITAATLLEHGISRVTASYDLNMAQLAAMSARSPQGSLEIVIHQHVPMFHMAHCLAAACLSDAEDCGSCGRPCRSHKLHLRDRNGVDHLLRSDMAGRNTVYNTRIQSAAALRPALQALEATHWRIELLDESPDDSRRILDEYAGWIIGDVSSEQLLRVLKSHHTAGVSAGTFDLP